MVTELSTIDNQHLLNESMGLIVMNFYLCSTKVEVTKPWGVAFYTWAESITHIAELVVNLNSLSP